MLMIPIKEMRKRKRSRNMHIFSLPLTACDITRSNLFCYFSKIFLTSRSECKNSSIIGISWFLIVNNLCLIKFWKFNVGDKPYNEFEKNKKCITFTGTIRGLCVDLIADFSFCICPFSCFFWKLPHLSISCNSLS